MEIIIIIIGMQITFVYRYRQDLKGEKRNNWIVAYHSSRLFKVPVNMLIHNPHDFCRIYSGLYIVIMCSIVFFQFGYHLSHPVYKIDIHIISLYDRSIIDDCILEIPGNQ